MDDSKFYHLEMSAVGKTPLFFWLLAACTPPNAAESILAEQDLNTPQGGGDPRSQGMLASVDSNAMLGPSDSNNQTGLASVTIDELPIALDIQASTQPKLGTPEQQKTYSYAPSLAQESLYGPTGEPRPQDVQGRGVLGALANPVYYSLMASMASVQPAWLKSGIRYVSTGAAGVHTYMVRLYVPSPLENTSVTPQTKLIEAYVPTDDTFMRTANGSRGTLEGNVLWPAIYEKALFKLLNARDEKLAGQTGSPSAQASPELFFPSDAAGILLGKRWDDRFSKPVLDANNKPLYDNEGHAYTEINWPELITGVQKNNAVILLFASGTTFYDKQKKQFVEERQLSSGNRLKWDATSHTWIYIYANSDTVALKPGPPLSVLNILGDQMVIRRFPINQIVEKGDDESFSMPLVDLPDVWASIFATSWYN